VFLSEKVVIICRNSHSISKIIAIFAAKNNQNTADKELANSA
jgi:hypothetical protein